MSQLNMLIEQVFNSLAGSWQVERIVDGSARVSGTASFERSQSPADELLYTERGLVKLPYGKQLSARQSYIYKLHAGSISVFFDEEPQRLFHNIEFEISAGGSLQGRGSHQCKQDNYQIKYHFFTGADGGLPALNNFDIEYTVVGPRKCSTILCRYQLGL
jgi:hypothetical protein